jgi:hypothetical protein
MRDQRKHLALKQLDLASLGNTGNRFIVDLENGKQANHAAADGAGPDGPARPGGGGAGQGRTVAVRAQ